MLYPCRELTITSKVQECCGREFGAKLGEFDYRIWKQVLFLDIETLRWNIVSDFNLNLNFSNAYLQIYLWSLFHCLILVAHWEYDDLKCSIFLRLNKNENFLSIKSVSGQQANTSLSNVFMFYRTVDAKPWSVLCVFTNPRRIFKVRKFIIGIFQVKVRLK